MKVIAALQFGRQLGEPTECSEQVWNLLHYLAIGMDPAPSRQILKRLEAEGLS